MREFQNLEAFIRQLEKIHTQYPEKEYKALNLLGAYLEKKAKDTIGWLQPDAGPYASWAPLAESTKLDKQRQGYVFNGDFNPLYRTGELKESIHHVVNRAKRALYVGSADEVMIYHEFGTSRMPPRPVLGLTFFKEKTQIQYFLGSFLLNWVADINVTFRVK